LSHHAFKFADGIDFRPVMFTSLRTESTFVPSCFQNCGRNRLSSRHVFKIADGIDFRPVMGEVMGKVKRLGMSKVIEVGKSILTHGCNYTI
jgi:hypothetical protein